MKDNSLQKDPVSEMFEVIDEEGSVIGLAPRRECHGNPSLIHRVVHVLVANGEGDLLLQRRSHQKDIQPGKWDTSVGGHLHPGEDYERAGRREMAEELGILNGPLMVLYDYRWRSPIESEQVRTYLCQWDGPFHPDEEEILEARFWSPEEICHHLGDGTFTPNFEEEFARYLQWKGRMHHA